MNALVIHEYGGPEVLKYEQFKKPVIKNQKTDIVVKIVAAGINAGENVLRSGKVKSMVPVQFPAVLGLAFSGIIEELGNKVTGFEIGEEVYGTLHVGSVGTYAEYILVDKSKDFIFNKPKTIEHEQAAAIGEGSFTAYCGLVDNCGLKKGQRIVIIGAAGSIGCYAVQFAKLMGAYVIGICSTKSMTMVKSLGADEVIDYSSADFRENILKLEKIDCTFDTVGGDDYYDLFDQITKYRGVYATAVGPERFGGDKPSNLLWVLSILGTILWRKITFSRNSNYSMILNQNRKKVGIAIHSYVQAEKLKPVAISEFSLKDGAQAHRILSEHKQTGKLILKP